MSSADDDKKIPKPGAFSDFPCDSQDIFYQAQNAGAHTAVASGAPAQSATIMTKPEETTRDNPEPDVITDIVSRP